VIRRLLAYAGALAACTGTLVAQLAAVGDPSHDSVDALHWQLATVDGQPATLQRYRGRVLVVNLWATWCEPCVAELASLQRLSSTLADTTIAIVLVAADRAEAVRPFIRRRRLTLPVLLEQAPPPAVFGAPILPTTWIIDRAGRIVQVQRGARAWDDPRVVAALRALAR
jgi:peroxiredoxin